MDNHLLSLLSMSANFDKLPNEMFHKIIKLITIDITVDYLNDLCTINKRWCDMINTLKLYMYKWYDINQHKDIILIRPNNKIKGKISYQKLQNYCTVYMKNHTNDNLRGQVYFYRREGHDINRKELDDIAEQYKYDNWVVKSFTEARYHGYITFSSYAHSNYTVTFFTKYKINIEKYRWRFDSLRYVKGKLNYHSLKLLELVFNDLVMVYGNIGNIISGTSELGSFHNPYFPKGKLNKNAYGKDYNFFNALFNHIKRAPNYE